MGRGVGRGAYGAYGYPAMPPFYIGYYYPPGGDYSGAQGGWRCCSGDTGSSSRDWKGPWACDSLGDS